jgi:hypothetical protein
MPSVHPRSLELLVLQALRAKGVRYPNTISAQKECFKTWYSYALRRGEVTKATTVKEIQDHGSYLNDVRDRPVGGRTYM